MLSRHVDECIFITQSWLYDFVTSIVLIHLTKTQEFDK